jgi:hypothetical protein
MANLSPLPIRRTGPAAPPQMAQPELRKQVTFGKVGSAAGHRVLLYGPGGIGKTTLAAQLPGPVAFIDLDESLPRLRLQLAAAGRLDNLMPVDGVADWAGLRAVLQSPGWEAVKSIVIDTGTKAEELAVAWTLENVMQDGKRCTSVEGYGYGKGYGYVFDTFLALLGDLDRHSRAGRNVVIICHDCTSTVPNPSGEDWLRYEPRLQSPASGKASIRLRVREWADHVLFIGYDVAVNKDGKGQGSGTRTLYTAELPHCMAKSRSTNEQIPVDGDGAVVWDKIIGQ